MQQAFGSWWVLSGVHLVSCSMSWEAGAYCPAGIGSCEVKSIVADGYSLTGLRAGELADLPPSVLNTKCQTFSSYEHACLLPSSVTSGLAYLSTHKEPAPTPPLLSCLLQTINILCTFASMP